MGFGLGDCDFEVVERFVLPDLRVFGGELGPVFVLWVEAVTGEDGDGAQCCWDKGCVDVVGDAASTDACRVS